MIYDYIIIGAGLGGLAAGLNLSVNGKKVLMLEKNSLPGGRTSTFKRGRFEFNTTIHELYNYGNEEHIGEIQKLFSRFGLNIETQMIPFNNKIKVYDTKEEFELTGKFEDIVVKLEELKEGSLEPLREFIKITKEIHEGLSCLLNDDNTSLEEYPNFLKYLNMSTLDALTDLKIPKETINRLCFVYLDIASPINKLNFIDFAEYMYKIIFKKVVILKNKSLDLMIKLVKKYQNKGGKLYYNSLVINIKDEDGYKVVSTSDHKEYKAKNIICDLAPRYVYTNLIQDSNKDLNRLENARTLSANSLTVYLGLNADASIIGLKNHKYYHFDVLNSEKNINKMNTAKHRTWQAIVPNIVDATSSPKNTTILILKTDYYGDIFSKVTSANYYKIKEELAEDLINQFENAFNINIKQYIEEMEISTPFTFAKYTNSPNGSSHGYMRLGYDNSINRILSFTEESQPNISFVGSSSIFGSGADNAFYSGYYITKKLLESEGKHE